MGHRRCLPDACLQCRDQEPPEDHLLTASAKVVDRPAKPSQSGCLPAQLARHRLGGGRPALRRLHLRVGDALEQLGSRAAELLYHVGGDGLEHGV